MIGTLQFNLDDKDDRMAHLRATKSLDMALVIWDINQKVRYWIKNLDTINPETIQEEIFEIYEKYDINIDTLIE